MVMPKAVRFQRQQQTTSYLLYFTRHFTHHPAPPIGYIYITQTFDVDP